jgi:hypothetical protein
VEVTTKLAGLTSLIWREAQKKEMWEETKGHTYGKILESGTSEWIQPSEGATT